MSYSSLLTFTLFSAAWWLRNCHASSGAAALLGYDEGDLM